MFQKIKDFFTKIYNLFPSKKQEELKAIWSKFLNMSLKDLTDFLKDKLISPDYYKTDVGIEAIDLINAFGGDYYLGCAIKYLFRAGKKTDTTVLSDLKKAVWYLEKYIEKNNLNSENQADVLEITSKFESNLGDILATLEKNKELPTTIFKILLNIYKGNFITALELLLKLVSIILTMENEPTFSVLAEDVKLAYCDSILVKYDKTINA